MQGRVCHSLSHRDTCSLLTHHLAGSPLAFLLLQCGQGLSCSSPELQLSRACPLGMTPVLAGSFRALSIHPSPAPTLTDFSGCGSRVGFCTVFPWGPCIPSSPPLTLTCQTAPGLVINSQTCLSCSSLKSNNVNEQKRHKDTLGTNLIFKFPPSVSE